MRSSFFLYLTLINIFLAWTAAGQTNIFPTSGKVGIGTLSPSTTVEVVSNASTGNVPIIELDNISGATPNTFGPGIIFNNHVAGKFPFIIQERQDVTSRFSISRSNSPYTDFFCILQNGNVLIGKWYQVNASYKLDVNGNIRADKVVVNTTGADYVFDSTYQLISIKQLKEFILSHNHLPGIQSADQMQANGLDVGKNQIQLLKKIEELTLYQISSDEMIRQLKEDMEKYKHELSLLKDRMKNYKNQSN